MRILPPHDNPYFPYSLVAKDPEEEMDFYQIKYEGKFAIGYCALPEKEKRGWYAYLVEESSGDFLPRNTVPFPSFSFARDEILGYAFRHGLSEGD